MDPESFKCPKCGYVNVFRMLSKHCRKEHDIEVNALRQMLFLGDKKELPTCECGCGKLTRFVSLKEGFSKFAPGHQSRVNNNWGHNKKALDKSHAETKRRYDAGEIDVWNKGLTKSSDERVAAYGVKISQVINSNVEEIKKRSERMKQNRLNGTIQTLYGKEHSHWKGGVSSAQQLSRSYVFNVWTYPKLLASGFSCQKCASKKDLEVHHDKERFAAILQKAREALGDVTEDFESVQAYACWVSDYHVKNDVSGIVLCSKCHDSEHAAA